MIAEMTEDSDLVNVSNRLFPNVLSSYLLKQARQKTWRPDSQKPTVFTK
jgi:hypothetical protein